MYCVYLIELLPFHSWEIEDKARVKPYEKAQNTIESDLNKDFCFYSKSEPIHQPLDPLHILHNLERLTFLNCTRVNKSSK